MGEILSALWQDIKENSFRDNCKLVGAVAVMTTHQLGAEVTLVATGATVMGHVDNPIAMPLAVGASMAAVSGAIETAVTHVSTASIDKFPHTSEVMIAKEEVERVLVGGVATDSDSGEGISGSDLKGGERKESFIEKFQRFTMLLGLGTSGLILREKNVNPDSTHEDLIKAGSRGRKVLMGVNCGLGVATAGVAKGIDGITGLPATETITSALKTPYPYVGLFALGRISGLASHFKKKKLIAVAAGKSESSQLGAYGMNNLKTNIEG